MKILFVSPLKENSGWSSAGIGYLLAMDSVGLDVVARTIKLNNEQPTLPKRALELEQKESSCDIAIFHCLPHQYEYHGGMLNVLLFASETSSLPYNWVRHINMADVVWTINESQKQACLDAGVTKPIDVVNHACDLDKYSRSYSQLEPLSTLTKGTFKFYTVGELTRRKNLTALIRAFNTEFKFYEPVSLIIKTNIYGVNPMETQKAVDQLSQEVKNGLRLYQNRDCYKREFVFSENLSEEDLCKLHVTADCFVQTSYGEAWSYPAMDALGFGKTPIVPNHTGYREYIDDDCGWLVNVDEEACFGAQTIDGLQTARESWWAINTLDLQRKMRAAYQGVKSREEKRLACLDRIERYSYQRIGQKIKSLLTKYETQKKKT